MRFRHAAVLSVIVLTAFSAQGLSAAAFYRVTDLGVPPGGVSSSAYAISNNGKIAGWFSDGNGHPRAFLYANGTMTDLGTLGGTYSHAQGVNDSGQVVGDSDTGGGAAHAFLYTAGSMTDLGVLPGYTASSYAAGINAAGQIVGSSTSTANWPRAFLYSNGTMTELGSFPGSDGGSYASAINAHGQVVGNAFLAPSKQHAFLYSDGKMTDLGTLPGYTTFSTAQGINSAGQVVGISMNITSQSTTQRPFLYADGTMTDLNALIDSASGWTIGDARAINDSGWIVGTGSNGGPLNHAVLLTPVLMGDANLDGTVDISDLNKVLTNYDKTHMKWGQGDFDGNGLVDVADLNKMLTNYDNSAASPATALTSVPEPPSLALLSIIAAGALIRFTRSEPDRCG